MPYFFLYITPTYRLGRLTPLFPFIYSGTLTHQHTDILSHIVSFHYSATCGKLHRIVFTMTSLCCWVVCLHAVLLLTSYMHRPMNGVNLGVAVSVLFTQRSNIKYMNLGSLWKGATLHATGAIAIHALLCGSQSIPQFNKGIGLK